MARFLKSHLLPFVCFHDIITIVAEKTNKINFMQEKLQNYDKHSEHFPASGQKGAF